MLIGEDVGPTTTAEEDLEYLGLSTLTESRRSAPASASGMLTEGKKKGGYNGDGNGNGNDDEDEDDDENGDDEDPHAAALARKEGAEARSDVPVRSEDESEDDIGDLAVEGLDAEDFALVEYLVDLDENDLEDIDEETLAELHAVLETDLLDRAHAAFAEDDELSRYNAALNVVDSFYEEIDQLKEGDEQPTYDDLVGVIEAYEALAEETGLLTERFRGAMKAKLKRGKRKMMRTGRGKRLKRALGRARKRGKFVVGGQMMTRAQKMKELRKQLKGAKGRYAKSIRQKIKATRGGGKRNGGNYAGPRAESSEQDNSLGELVKNLSDLKSTVESSADQASAAEELIEGFSSISSVAKQYYERIADEVSEDKDVGEDDPRVAMGRYLESICNDATERASALADGEDRWSIDQFAEDLQALAADLDDAMEAMKEID